MLERDFDSDHFLKHAYCHFHDNHKRVKEFVTLTASVYHPLIRKQLILATMNCKHKIVTMLSGSAKNLVRLPGKLTQPKKYGWITDTAVSTFNGLAIVYREDILSRDKR